MIKILLKRDFFKTNKTLGGVQFARYRHADADNNIKLIYQAVCNDVRHAHVLDTLAIAQVKRCFKDLNEIEVEIQ